MQTVYHIVYDFFAIVRGPLRPDAGHHRAEPTEFYTRLDEAMQSAACNQLHASIQQGCDTFRKTNDIQAGDGMFIELERRATIWQFTDNREWL